MLIDTKNIILILETKQLAEKIDQKNGSWKTLSLLKKLRKQREKHLQKIF